MPDRIYTVSADFENSDDAVALADIIKDLGFKATVIFRDVATNRPATPMREQRLGKLILRFMTPTEGATPRTFTYEQIGEYLETVDYRSTSASPALSKLVEQGDVDKVGTSLYRLKR